MDYADWLEELKPADDFWPDVQKMLLIGYTLRYGQEPLRNWFNAAAGTCVSDEQTPPPPALISARLEVYIHAMLTIHAQHQQPWGHPLFVLGHHVVPLRRAATAHDWEKFSTTVHKFMETTAYANQVELQVLFLCYARAQFESKMLGHAPVANWNQVLENCLI